MGNVRILPQAKVLRAKEASQYVGIGVSTFWRWVQEGKIPQGRKISPRCTLWKVEDLDAYLESVMNDCA